MMSMQIKLVKLADRLMGAILSSCFSSAPMKILPIPRRFLVIRPGGIGDAVMLLPTIEALAQFLPGADIEVLAECRNFEVFTCCSAVTRTWCYDRLPELSGVLRQRYDVVIDTEQWYRLSAVVARLTQAPRIIGFSGNSRERLLTDVVPYKLNTFEGDMFLSLLSPLGYTSKVPTDCRLALSNSVHPLVTELLSPLEGKPYIVIFPGASVSEKVWPLDRFQSVAHFVSSHGYIPVVVGGSKECFQGAKIITGLNGLNLAGKTSLNVVATIIGRARAMVSGDSGLLHIASAMGVPLVALFGPSDPRKWGPRGDAVRILSAVLPCSPCSRYGTIPACADHHCMKMVSVDQVTTALDDLLSSV